MGRKTHKVLVLMLASLLLFTGCGDGNEDNTEVVDNNLPETNGEVISLKVWGAEEDDELLNIIVEKFKEEYKDQATFDITIEAAAESECKSIIFEDIENAADVFTFADDQLATLAAAGICVPMEDQESVKNRFLESAVSAATINDKIYAYPLTADNGYFLFYDKTYFKDEDLATLDGILAVCAKNNKKMTMDFSSGWYLYAFFGNTGLEVGLNADGISNYCTWNSTENAIKGVDVLAAMTAAAQNSGFLNAGDDGLVSGAKDGSVIAGVSGTWLGNSLKEAWGDNLGAVKLPTYTVAGTQVQMASFKGYKFIGVNDYSKHKEWADLLAQYITSEENETLRFEIRGQGPADKNASTSGEVAKSVAIQAVIAQSEYADLQRVGSAYWGPAGNIGNAAITGSTGGLSAQDFLDNQIAQMTVSNTED